MIAVIDAAMCGRRDCLRAPFSFGPRYAYR